MNFLYLDTETYSPIPIKCGVHRYAEDAEIMVISFAKNDEPVEVWDLTDNQAGTYEINQRTVELLGLIDDADKVVIHNSSFDRTILRHVLGIDIPVNHIHDTLVQARTVGLPGGLGALCDIFKIGTDKAKDKKGKDLINLFCKPRPKNSILRRATHETHPQEWSQFIEYARLDIEAMRAIHHKLPIWNYRDREYALWELDQSINDFGVCVDTDLARAAIKAIDETKQELNDSTREATLGLIGSATQRDELLRFILGFYGVELPDLQASTIERRLNDPEIPRAVKELLAIRLQICTTSTAKYKTLLDRVSSDGRLRGILEFCGAGRTARWAGRGFQPQNLPSRNLLPAQDIEDGIKLLKQGCADLVFSNIMKLTSSCIRGAIIAPPGKFIYAADLANIEGRFGAWVAEEAWKIKAFLDFDAGKGSDLYKLSYARAFNIDPDDVTKVMRQIGKVMELFLQYEGGVGAFLTGALTYDIDLDQMADAAWDSIPAHVMREAKRTWSKKKAEEIQKKKLPGELTFGLPEKTYIVCDSLKLMWREAHPEISSIWGELKNTVILAINTPGKQYDCRKLKIRRDGSWLRIILPSGRALCYASPRVENGQISYLGMNQYTRRWSRIKTYGGKLFENICQGGARDVMAENMPLIDEAGYDIILTVHDEVVTEAPDTDEYSVEGLSALLATNPPWALDLPLAAGGFKDVRYRKD